MSCSDSSERRPTVFLIGFMASGKTTLGRALATATGRRFVDLDDYIESSEGKTVSRIFKESGEAGFRRMESEALSRLIDNSAGSRGLIVACGGGTPCHARNMDLILSSGISVWLTASLPVVMRRLLAAQSTRPLVASFDDPQRLEAFVSATLADREPFYSRAHYRFDSSRLESEAEIEQSVKAFIDQFLK